MVGFCAKSVLQTVAEIVLPQGVGGCSALGGVLKSLLWVPVGAISHEEASAQPRMRVGVVVLGGAFEISGESSRHVVGTAQCVRSLER